MKETLIQLKKEIDSNIIIVGDLNTSLLITDRASRQKINTETGDFNNNKHIQNIPSQSNRMLIHIKKIEIMPCIFSDHNGRKLEINSRGKTGKSINMWKLNTLLFKN